MFFWTVFFFFLRSTEKNFFKTFFLRKTFAFVSLVLGLEHSCPWPWPRIFFVLGLGLEPCVLDSTSDAKALTQRLWRIATTRADEMDFIMLHCDARTSEQILVVIGQKKKSWSLWNTAIRENWHNLHTTSRRGEQWAIDANLKLLLEQSIRCLWNVSLLFIGYWKQKRIVYTMINRRISDKTRQSRLFSRIENTSVRQKY